MGKQEQKQKIVLRSQICIEVVQQHRIQNKFKQKEEGKKTKTKEKR
uniref:Uncharacterized protein n=1 Tax=Trypanosoma brucei TaxID=5691 RepID=Q581P4_9TRYP|nr:hypothetical protein, unlikely [Trypanosoma brucei]